MAEGSNRKRINLALQGGGAHGAFTWGVIDALLEDGRIDIEGISGTSAGAVNAVLLASGLATGGPDAARAALAGFWRAASHDGHLPDAQRAVVDRLMSWAPVAPVTLAEWWFDQLSRFWSPYELNPLNINPLKGLIDKFVDFPAIQSRCRSHVYVSATNVRTGKLRVFGREEITADVVMASACLPTIFQAVELDDGPYWDGGYTGNPPLWPFFEETATEDLLLVQINPVERQDTPRSSDDIMNRLNEITFNAPLLGELRAIAFVAKLVDAGKLPRGMAAGEYRRIKMHRVALDSVGLTLDAGSKRNTDYDFFLELRDAGRTSAHSFLAEHYGSIGHKDSFDISRMIEAKKPRKSSLRW